MKYHNVDLHNVRDIILEDGQPGFTISRLPLAIHPDINEGARRMSFLSGGAEIRGMLPENGRAVVTLQALDENVVPPVVTVFLGSSRFRQCVLPREPMEIIIEEPANMPLMSAIHDRTPQPFGPRLVRICLPHIHKIRIVSIAGDLTYPEPTALPARTLLCYGSSITHGAHAIVPETTYVSQCGYHLGYDVINLGLGGSAHMDAAVADHIASRDDWDLATLEMGVNVRTWDPERFRAAVDRFVTTIVSAHPDKLVFCIDLFPNNYDFMDEPPGAIGFREIVKDVAARQNSAKVIHVDGRSLQTRPSGLQVDLVHPNEHGMIEIGRNLATLISGYVR